MAGLRFGGGAGRAGGDGDVVEAHEQRFAVHAFEADVQVVRQARQGGAVEAYASKLLQSREEPVLERRQPLLFLLYALEVDRAGGAEADDADGPLSPR